MQAGTTLIGGVADQARAFSGLAPGGAMGQVGRSPCLVP